jgi:hypothetical protein
MAAHTADTGLSDSHYSKLLTGMIKVGNISENSSSLLLFFVVGIDQFVSMICGALKNILIYYFLGCWEASQAEARGTQTMMNYY